MDAPTEEMLYLLKPDICVFQKGRTEKDHDLHTLC